MGRTATTTSSTKKQFVLRDKDGWKTLVAVSYAFVGNVVAVWWMIQLTKTTGIKDDDSTSTSLVNIAMNSIRWFLAFTPSMVLSAHSKMIASYLVHETCHDSVFVSKQDNQRLGWICIWLSGCPYTNFHHIKRMHVAHHVDRTDLVEFDYRSFVKSHAVLRAVVLSLEFVCIPAVETIMHLRQAFIPIVAPRTLPETNRTSRFWSSVVGTTVSFVWYGWLAHQGILVPYVMGGMILLHGLALNDAFHHTYEATFPEDYTPGPGSRTAQYEEDNTYSNIWSRNWPTLNVLMLNFGYHNAHHKRPMVPWHHLPAYHNKLYSSNAPTTPVTKQNVVDKQNASSSVESSKTTSSSPTTIVTDSSPQVLSLSDIWSPWYVHRLRRVLEEDYCIVHPSGTPNRASDFVGALGVSFMTV